MVCYNSVYKRDDKGEGTFWRTHFVTQEAFKRLGLSIMGTASSKLEKSLPSSFPDSERLFGLENVHPLPLSPPSTSLCIPV